MVSSPTLVGLPSSFLLSISLFYFLFFLSVHVGVVKEIECQIKYPNDLHYSYPLTIKLDSFTKPTGEEYKKESICHLENNQYWGGGRDRFYLLASSMKEGPLCMQNQKRPWCLEYKTKIPLVD